MSLFIVIDMSETKGKIYLIPSPLSERPICEVLPQKVLDIIPAISHFVVEEIRTARRFLSAAGLKGKIDTLNFYELNEHSKPEQAEEYITLAMEGNDIGVISEAGLPAVADPGALLVAAAHRNGIKVVPLVGPSSLMMALMASGLNGQCFAFTGYLPAKPDQRRDKIKLIERVSASLKQTQIIIETPYRNNQLFNDLISVCNPRTRICVASDITGDRESIVTKSVAQWKSFVKDSSQTLDKVPAVFLLLA